MQQLITIECHYRRRATSVSQTRRPAPRRPGGRLIGTLCAAHLLAGCTLWDEKALDPIDLTPVTAEVETAEPREPGSIAVQVSLARRRADPPNYASDPFCHKHRQAATKRRKKRKAKAGAIVHLLDSGRQDTSTFADMAHMQLRDCSFTSPMALVQAGATLKLSHRDETMHIIEARDQDGKQLFRSAQPPGASPTEEKLGPGVQRVDLSCQTHPWEQAWVVVVAETGRTKQTDGQGKVRFTGLSPGPYDFIIWRWNFAENRSTVDVRAGETAELSVALQPAG